VSVKGADLFCTNQPCSICAKMIINAGIAKIYYRSGYADDLARDMLAEARIDLIQIVGSEADEKLEGDHSAGEASNESIHSGGGGE
jgi:dCMP deaminase